MKRLEKLLRSFRHRHFKQILRVVVLFMTVLFVVFNVALASQRLGNLRERMTDSANLLALRVQALLTSAQETLLTIASLDSTNALLHQETLAMEPLRRLDGVLSSVSNRYASVELHLARARRMLISDFGIDDNADYPDAAFLAALPSTSTLAGAWTPRVYRKSAYLDPLACLSLVRSVPLYSLQSLGQIVVNLSLDSLRAAAASAHDPALGGYALPRLIDRYLTKYQM